MDLLTKIDPEDVLYIIAKVIKDELSKSMSLEEAVIDLAFNDDCSVDVVCKNLPEDADLNIGETVYH